MAKLTTAEFIDAIKELTVLELNDLVKACEEEFGVSAAAGVVVAAAGDGAAASVSALEKGQVATNKTDIAGLKTKVENLESVNYVAITNEQIDAMFA